MHLLRVRQSGENLQINRFRSVQSPSLRKKMALVKTMATRTLSVRVTPATVEPVPGTSFRLKNGCFKKHLTKQNPLKSI